MDGWYERVTNVMRRLRRYGITVVVLGVTSLAMEWFPPSSAHLESFLRAGLGLCAVAVGILIAYDALISD